MSGIRTWMFLVTLMSAFAVAPTADAQNPFGEMFRAVGNIFGRPAPPPKPPPPRIISMKGIEVDADFSNKFTAPLRKMLNAELHFVRKVCEPTDEEFAAIYRRGIQVVAKMARHYETQEQAGQRANTWELPAKVFLRELPIEFSELLTPEKLVRYTTELEARKKALDDAARGMTVVAIDADCFFTPHQIDAVDQHLQENWSQAWSRNHQMYMYTQYMPLPSTAELGDQLTDAQAKNWSARSNRGRVSFGWEFDFGAQNHIAGNNNGLPPIAEPAPIVNEAGQAEPEAKSLAEVTDEELAEYEQAMELAEAEE